jgi:Ser/Thr protein kinase RdoA (MazF antagonist)
MKNYDNLIKTIVLTNWPKEKIKSINQFSYGYTNRSFDVKLSKKCIVVKLMKNNNSTERVKKELKIIKLLKKRFNDFPVREIIKIGKVKNQNYTIYKKVEGVDLKTAYSKIKNKSKIFYEMGILRGKMHSIKYTKFGEFNNNLKIIKGNKNWDKIISKRVTRIFYELKNKEYVTKQFIDEQKLFWKNHKYIIKQDNQPVLCHGDLSINNFIVNSENKKYYISGVIDFEYARPSSAIQDLFKTTAYFKILYLNLEPFLKGYLKFNKLPKDWKKLMWLYHWYANIKHLNDLKTSKWKDLTNTENEQIKKKNIKKCFKEIKQTNLILERNKF